MEEKFNEQRLAVMLSGDRIGNKGSKRKIAQANGCQLINTKSRRYETTGTVNGTNIVLL